MLLIRYRVCPGRYANGKYLEDNAFTLLNSLRRSSLSLYLVCSHDVSGLMEVMGGEIHCNWIPCTSEERYWHSNEPCRQMAYV